jgi:hypothetical protein
VEIWICSYTKREKQFLCQAIAVVIGSRNYTVFFMLRRIIKSKPLFMDLTTTWKDSLNLKSCSCNV